MKLARLATIFAVLTLFAPPVFALTKIEFDLKTGVVKKVEVDGVIQKSLDPELARLVSEASARVEKDVAQGSCTGGPTTLCAQGGRFRIDMTWATVNSAGNAQAVQLNANSGTFWFFSADNSEMLVKVLDGCGLGNHFWVFYAATTNVHFVLQVTDIPNSIGVIYGNPLNHKADPIQDTSAFLCP